MNELLSERHGQVFVITLNKTAKHNAFDDALLQQLLLSLQQAITDNNVRVIILKANGKHFSAGADAAWMQKMVHYSEEENIADATVLAQVMYTLYNSPKPVIAMVHGAAYGGGAGLVAACDIAIADTSAHFCFSEVKLGLIPAVISPYVIKAIGERATRWLFLSAEVFYYERAQALNLIHQCVAPEELWTYTLKYAQQICQLAPQAISECKTLIDQVVGRALDGQLIQDTVKLIAKKRVSAEAQCGLRAFLNKETPDWS